MSNRPKLLFVYDHKYPDRWMDGLSAALTLLEEDFEVSKYNLACEKNVSIHFSDFILGWGGFNSSVDKFIQSQIRNPHELKKGLCIAGNAFPPTGADNYDVLFYETKWYRPQINFHKNIVHAFGINTDIFNIPSFTFPIIFDYIGVGAIASWKRWEKLVSKHGIKLVVGEYQTQDMNSNEESLSIANHLLSNSVMVSPMVNPYDLANLYHWSRTCYIPADINGGGERAILEARACGLKVEIEDDNPKLKEILEGPIYDHHYYASQLKKGIMGVL